MLAQGRGLVDVGGLAEDLTLEALDRALLERRPGPGLLHHSDRGSQYASYEIPEEAPAARAGAEHEPQRQLLGQRSCRGFFSTLKREAIPEGGFVTRDQARAALFDWIEVVYNRSRRHSSIGRVSPAAYEAKRQEKVA